MSRTKKTTTTLEHRVTTRAARALRKRGQHILANAMLKVLGSPTWGPKVPKGTKARGSEVRGFDATRAATNLVANATKAYNAFQELERGTIDFVSQCRAMSKEDGSIEDPKLRRAFAGSAKGAYELEQIIDKIYSRRYLVDMVAEAKSLASRLKRMK